MGNLTHFAKSLRMISLDVSTKVRGELSLKLAQRKQASLLAPIIRGTFLLLVRA